MPPHLQKGRLAEDQALAYLQANGLSLQQRNYRSPFGEVDLIMHDASCDSLIFVEVRYRSNNTFGSPAESVDRRKQAKLIASAEHYRQQNPHLAKQPCRFDVVGICGDIDNGSLQWYPNAF